MSLPRVDDDLGVVVDLGVGVDEDWDSLNKMEDASVPRVTWLASLGGSMLLARCALGLSESSCKGS